MAAAQSNRHRRGFSLVELVIVVVIMGVIAAVAIPRLSRGARTAGASALKGDLATLRNAIELYAAEHDGNYPGATIANQLTQYSNSTGTVTSATKTATEVYGPYLKEIPPMPVGTNKGDTNIDVVSATPTGLTTNGWWYSTATQEIRANLPVADVDDDGTAYNTY